MDENFLTSFKRFTFLRLPDLMNLFKISSIKSFKKGDILASEGKYCECTFLIIKGIIRTYVLTEDGTERTIKLAKEKDFTSCWASLMYGKVSTEYLEVLEDCRVIAINTKRLNELSKDNIRILRLFHEGLKEAFKEAILRVEFFTVLSPEERYKLLLEKSPELIQRVPQKYLASYLGITTVSLSRIRNRN